MRRMDKEIKQDIIDQLTLNSRNEAADVTVAVKHVVVILGGSVPHYSSLKVAEKNARATHGAVLVENNISASPQALSTSGASRVLKRQGFGEEDGIVSVKTLRPKDANNRIAKALKRNSRISDRVLKYVETERRV